MFPIHFKLTISTPEELARVTAFIGGDYSKAVAAAPRIDSVVSAEEKAALLEAPGKPSAAKAARSLRTVEAAPSAPAPSVAAPAASTEVTPPAAAAASAVDYPTLQKAVLTLHKMDPTAAIPIAKSLGADSFKVLKPEQWAEALAAVNAAIETRKAA